MIYRGPGFLAVWSGSSPTPSPQLPSASCLSFSVLQFVAGRAYWREGGGNQIIRRRESLVLNKSYQYSLATSLVQAENAPLPSALNTSNVVCPTCPHPDAIHVTVTSMPYSGRILMKARLWMTCSCITSFACLLLQLFSGCRGCRVEYVREYEWHNTVFQRAAVYWNLSSCVTAIPNTATTPVTVPSSILINNGTANAT